MDCACVSACKQTNVSLLWLWSVVRILFWPLLSRSLSPWGSRGRNARCLRLLGSRNSFSCRRNCWSSSFGWLGSLVRLRRRDSSSRLGRIVGSSFGRLCLRLLLVSVGLVVQWSGEVDAALIERSRSSYSFDWDWCGEFVERRGL